MQGQELHKSAAQVSKPAQLSVQGITPHVSSRLVSNAGHRDVLGQGRDFGLLMVVVLAESREERDLVRSSERLAGFLSLYSDTSSKVRGFWCSLSCLPVIINPH